MTSLVAKKIKENQLETLQKIYRKKLNDNKQLYRLMPRILKGSTNIDNIIRAKYKYNIYKML